MQNEKEKLAAFPESMQETRKQQLLIRGKGTIKGQLVPRPKDGKKPKGSRNVARKPAKLPERKESEYTMDETLSGEKLRQPPMVDFNSSFDDIDTAVFFNPDGEAANECSEKVIFRAPVKKITFNPVSSKLSDIARQLQLLPASRAVWRENDESSVTDSVCSKEAESDAIYRADDSDYYSIDLSLIHI